jgi:hypothetical protein
VSIFGFAPITAVARLCQIVQTVFAFTTHGEVAAVPTPATAADASAAATARAKRLDGDTRLTIAALMLRLRHPCGG